MLVRFSARTFRTATSVMAALFAVAAAAQSPSPVIPGFGVGSVPTGLQPLGIDIVYPAGGSTNQSAARAIVANSGENSVSILSLRFTSVLEITFDPIMTKVTGIPSPYAVAACPRVDLKPPQYVLVTSPSDNSVRVLQVPEFGAPGPVTLVGTLRVGPQPHSIACWTDAVSAPRIRGVVSNVGDNSLTVFDVATATVTGTIPNVPATRGFHGIGIIRDDSTRSTALVAGTGGNVVTLVDLASLRVLKQIPVARPTTIFSFYLSPLAGSFLVPVASAADNQILALSYPNYQVILTYHNLPNPQDVVDSALGLFATMGGQDSLSYWEREAFGTTPSIIPGLPGAAAIAGAVLVATPDPFRLRQIRVTAVLVTATNSNSVFVIQIPKGQPPTPSEFRIANGASFATSQVTPGSLASAFVATGISQTVNASSFSVPLPKTLGGVTLKVGGNFNFNSNTELWEYSPAGSTDAPLAFVGPNQINFQVPTGIPPRVNVPAQLIKPGGTTLLTTFNILATAPGIFTVLQRGGGQGAVLNDDFSQNGSAQSILGAKPARRGSVIQIFATGAGETDPPLLAGEPAPASGNPLVLTQVQPTVTIGGSPARVLFSGMAPGFVGLWQINAEVPQDVSPGPAVPMTITAGGVASNTVTIAVQ